MEKNLFMPSWINVALVALGGAVGSVSRYLLRDGETVNEQKVRVRTLPI